MGGLLVGICAGCRMYSVSIHGITSKVSMPMAIRPAEEARRGGGAESDRFFLGVPFMNQQK
jgi:hypothetical protein